MIPALFLDFCVRRNGALCINNLTWPVGPFLCNNPNLVILPKNVSSQSLVIWYLVSGVSLRYRARSCPEYSMLKLSMTRAKLVGWVSCFHRPGVLFVGWYQYGTRCQTSVSCAILTACGSSYITFVTLDKMYMLFILSLRL